MWLRFDPELRESYSQIKSAVRNCKDAGDSVSTWYASMRESTYESYKDVDDLDVLHNYHPWTKGSQIESEIRPARSALAWFSRRAEIFAETAGRVGSVPENTSRGATSQPCPGLIAYERAVSEPSSLPLCFSTCMH